MPVEHDTNKTNAGSGSVIDGVTVSGIPSTGQVITATSSSAADWQTPSSGGSFPTHSGSGHPEGVVTGSPGQSYEDTTNGAIWWKFSGTSTNTGWVMGDVMDATFEGTSSARPMDGFIEGSIFGDTGKPVLLLAGPTGTANASVVISDPAALVGTQNGMYYISGAADGDQSFSFITGLPLNYTTAIAANGAVGLCVNFDPIFSPGEIVMGMSYPAGGAGKARRSIGVSSLRTTNATSTALLLADGSSASYNFEVSNPRAALVSGKLVAARSDSTDTASAWTLPDSLIRYNGSAIVWQSGTAPTFSLVQQDSAASTWAATIAISGQTLVCTVTGQASQQIDWSLTLVLDRVN